MNSIKYFEYPSKEKLLGLPPQLGRWLFIPLGLIVLLCLGTVYSWSIFSGPFEAELQTKPGTILLPFMVLGITFTLVMPISGLYIYRFSPRIMTTVGGIIVGIGYLLASVAPNLPLLILSYGVIAGIGVGITYGVPLAVAARWFPDRKGLAVGLTVVGFGLSPLVTAPIALNLIKGNPQIGIPAFGIRSTFVILAIAFTIIISIIATVLKMPPPCWKPSGYASSEKLAVNNTDKNQSNILPMFQTQTFYGLWICYIVGTFVGLTAIATTAQVGKEIVGLQPEQLVWVVPLFAVFNGAGRPLFGWLNDRLKPKLTVITINLLILIASIVMLNTHNGQMSNFLVAFCLFWLCLGAWLAVAPAATLSFFGLENYPSNYGLIFTSFGIGGLSGIFTAGGIRGATGSFLPFFWVTATLACIAIILATFFLNPPRKTAIADFLFNRLISPISPGLLSLVEFFLMVGSRK
ncbi:OFA family MFS transporter [Calothrix sp. PCC 6303]|uniref:L-lactate MFS transporter n=1 Tax=Calothrix sp. PCC 6303 TaxID=1170562 RepID=UPI0002A020DD|nr:OFA family MFS transporter [Calothrix sp. PCC 6303]AFZ01417.1 major facilitator superfamily MFS_1 [Calothrix sp. PCC 6303]